MPNFGDFQLEIYLNGLTGVRPGLPLRYDELHRRAEAAMDPAIYAYVQGGAGNEATQEANVRAFDHHGLMPRMLAGAAERDLSIELFGHRLASPLLLSPIGVIGPCDPAGHGDILTAQAAARLGVPMVASTLSADPLEEVAAHHGETPNFFQLYTPRNRELAASFVNRAEQAGYSAIVVTLDTQILGWRPRDLTLGSFPQLRGLCLANYFSDPIFRDGLAQTPEDDPRAAALAWALGFADPGLSWDDLAWLRSLTDLPLLLKGICDPEDARRAIAGGADGIYCSNHGGRQANGGLAAIDLLGPVIEAVDDAVPVIFDSGVRAGEHIVKALALGARAVGVGRPYAWGLALGGVEGIVHVVRSLLAEADLLMGVDGYPDLAALRARGLVRI